MTLMNFSDRDNAERNLADAWDRSRQRLHAAAILFAACAVVAALPIRAQDVAEAARQEQARKERSKHKKHVYTEEDLARTSILTSEDRKQLEAKRRREQIAPAPENSPADVDAQLTLEALPLGDVARIFRAQKALAQAPQSPQFHLPYGSDTALAALKPDFTAPKPNPVKSVTHSTPRPPVFANSGALDSEEFNLANGDPAVAAPIATIEFVAPKPNPMHSSKRRAPRPPVFPNSPAPKAAGLNLTSGNPVSAPITPAEFVVAKPNSGHHPATRTPRPPVFPNAAAPRTIIVRSGDSLWKLAEQNLGDGHRWHELAAVNPSIVNPQHILAGTPIQVASGLPPGVAGSKITVHKGDSLWKLALRLLGFGSKFLCLMRANPAIVNANRIYVGQQLTLPSSCMNQPVK